MIAGFMINKQKKNHDIECQYLTKFNNNKFANFQIFINHEIVK